MEHAQRQSDIVLLGVNARYRHTSFGLRYLFANLGELRERAVIHETTLRSDAEDIAQQVLSYAPKLVGIGVYIWNVERCEAVVAHLKRLRPELTIVLGGPEVSHETETQSIVQQADAVVCGEGEAVFPAIAARALAGQPLLEPIVEGGLPDLTQLVSPYSLYNAEDITNRVIYVEASRGCPFKCQFCLSALDRSVRIFPLEPLFADLDRLLKQGARDFKFIDRTFNLALDFSLSILDFFLQRVTPDLSLHFEMIPDRLPEPLREMLSRFPDGMVQLEVGIQTFDPATAARIERRQNYTKTVTNLHKLATETGVHLHTDLIVGLPGETLDSFARGFDRLVALGPQEIQVGILKRLKGTPIIGHDACCQMAYNAAPPFDVVETGAMSRAELEEMKHFSRLWDRVANNGNFIESLPLLWADGGSPFAAFRALCDRVMEASGRSHSLSLLFLVELLLAHLTQTVGMPLESAREVLRRDYHRTPGRKRTRLLGGDSRHPVGSPAVHGGLRRQSRHLAGGSQR